MVSLSSTGRSMLSVAVKVFFCKLFLKFFLIHTGKAGGFIDLKVYNQNHQLSWWYALCLEGINTGSPTRALNEIYIRIKFTGYC